MKASGEFFDDTFQIMRYLRVLGSGNHSPIDIPICMVPVPCTKIQKKKKKHTVSIRGENKANTIRGQTSSVKPQIMNLVTPLSNIATSHPN